jgi:hypothetical protein
MYIRKFAKTSSLKGKPVIDRNALQSGHRNRFAGKLGVSKVNRSMQRFSCSRLPSVRRHVTVSKYTEPIALSF